MSVTAHAIVYENYGNPTQVIKSHSYKIDLNNLKPEEVVLQTLASPINPSDIVQIAGIYPSRPPISVDSLPEAKTPIAVTGNEGLFKIIAKGSDVSEFQIGDWVIPSSVNFGTWCTHRIHLKNEILKIPNDIPMNQAATLTVNPPSAYLMLNDIVKLQPGDWFVQNGANSQVGRLAIQMAKNMGVHSINIVRKKENFDDLVKDLTSIGATKVISQEDVGTEFFTEFLKGKNVKLGLDCVGGAASLAVAKVLSEYGKLVVYGSMTGQPLPLTVDLFLFKNITIQGFWLSKRLKNEAELKVSSTNAVVKLIKDGTLKESNVNETILKISELTDAKFLDTFVTAITNSNSGKQLIKFE